MSPATGSRAATRTLRHRTAARTGAEQGRVDLDFGSLRQASREETRCRPHDPHLGQIQELPQRDQGGIANAISWHGPGCEPPDLQLDDRGLGGLLCAQSAVACDEEGGQCDGQA